MTNNAIGTLLYPFWCLLFIIYLDLGIIGCALADVVSISLTYLFNLIYTSILDDISEAVFWPSFASLTVGDFNEQLKISIWSIFNSVVEGYSW